MNIKVIFHFKARIWEGEDGSGAWPRFRAVLILMNPDEEIVDCG